MNKKRERKQKNRKVGRRTVGGRAGRREAEVVKAIADGPGWPTPAYAKSQTTAKPQGLPPTGLGQPQPSGRPEPTAADQRKFVDAFFSNKAPNRKTRTFKHLGKIKTIQSTLNPAEPVYAQTLKPSELKSIFDHKFEERQEPVEEPFPAALFKIRQGKTDSDALKGCAYYKAWALSVGMTDTIDAWFNGSIACDNPYRVASLAAAWEAGRKAALDFINPIPQEFPKWFIYKSPSRARCVLRVDNKTDGFFVYPRSTGFASQFTVSRALKGSTYFKPVTEAEAKALIAKL